MDDKERLIHSTSIRSPTLYQKWPSFVIEVYTYVYEYEYSNIPTQLLSVNYNAKPRVSRDSALHTMSVADTSSPRDAAEKLSSSSLTDKL